MRPRSEVPSTPKGNTERLRLGRYGQRLESSFTYNQRQQQQTLNVVGLSFSYFVVFEKIKGIKLFVRSNVTWCRELRGIPLHINRGANERANIVPK